jgi:TRAP-type C4-dicarboxylate transport system substrate-binding protein
MNQLVEMPLHFVRPTLGGAMLDIRCAPWTRRAALVACIAALTGGLLAGCTREEKITLHGAVQFADEHTFNKTLLKFEALTKQYYGKPVEFVLHRNSELGLEKDYFAYLNQGISVDYAIVSPSHMSTFAPAAPLMDMPFLFQDLGHWRKVLEADALKPIADQVAEKADVLIIGYAGGGTRNLIINKPVHNLQELRGLKIRVMGAPVQTQTFQAMGAAPSVIAYAEIYNAIQTGVIEAAENEALGVEQMKFYEVGPNIVQTGHAITVRPICFSGKTYRRLPKDLQDAILRAGKEAGAYGRELEASEDRARLERMAQEGKIKLIDFPERARLIEMTAPVREAYAKEVGAQEVYAKIEALR